MTLTFPGAPLAPRPPETVNYRIDGPAHRLYWHPFPRRVRALFGSRTVLDTVSGKLLHESGLLPQLYVPRNDVDAELLVASEHQTHCPFKGDARYESVVAGDRLAENAVWSYPDPVDGAGWLTGHVALYWDAMDAWFDEEEEVFGHIRDPYHRVDVRPTSRHLRVAAGGIEVAQTRRAMLLSENGLPNRFYIPFEDLHTGYLAPSATHTVCPYKGTASYRSLHIGDTVVPDAAFYYPEPLQDAARVRGHVCFLAEGVETWCDGERVH